MTFSLYALLGESAPTITSESLFSELKNLFCNEEKFSIRFEQLPFVKGKTISLYWGDWLARVNYEEGEVVSRDSEDICKIVGAAACEDISGVTRRIRVVFGDDEYQEYTNQIIYIIDFLRKIPGIVIYDPQQRDFI